MSLPAQHREWWTAEEIAASGLPDMPASKRGVNLMAERCGWRGHPQFARQRAGRGGGREYFWKLFPSRAQAALVKPAAPAAPETRLDRDAAWRWFDGLPEMVKEKARARLAVIQRVDELAQIVSKFVAVDEIGRADGIASRTIWNWFEAIDGVDLADRLAYLAPKHRAAAPKRERAAFDPDVDFHPELTRVFHRELTRL